MNEKRAPDDVTVQGDNPPPIAERPTQLDEWESWNAPQSSAEPTSRESATPTDGPANTSELKAGTRVSQYEIIRELGTGGMGSVYLARDNGSAAASPSSSSSTRRGD